MHLKHKETVLLYENEKLRITQVDDYTYLVKSKNGTYGVITKSEENNEIIVVVKKNKYEALGRFIHLKQDDMQSVDDFIVQQTNSNILYFVSKTHLHSISKDFKPFLSHIPESEIDNLFTYANNGSVDRPKYKIISETHNHHSENFIYYYAFFKKKKIIESVYRYSHIFMNASMKPLKTVNFYRAADMVLVFSDLAAFVESKHHIGVCNISNKVKVTYGIQGCLTDKVDSIKHWCDISAIKILKYKKYYVNVVFENGKHTLYYMDHLTRGELQTKKYNKIETTLTGREISQESFLQVKSNIEDNKIIKESSFDLDAIERFETSLLNKILARKKILALKYPSDQLHKVALELDIKIEDINMDSLNIIDMYTC